MFNVKNQKKTKYFVEFYFIDIQMNILSLF